MLVGHLLEWALRRVILQILMVLQCQAAQLAALLVQVESCQAWGTFLAKAGETRRRRWRPWVRDWAAQRCRNPARDKGL